VQNFDCFTSLFTILNDNYEKSKTQLNEKHQESKIIRQLSHKEPDDTMIKVVAKKSTKCCLRLLSLYVLSHTTIIADTSHDKTNARCDSALPTSPVAATRFECGRDI